MPETTEIRDLLLGGDRSLDQLLQLRSAQALSPNHRRQLESLIIELMENPSLDGEPLSEEEAALIIGAGLWALGRLEEAIAALAGASSAEGDYMVGRCYLEAGFHERAARAFERAQRGKAATKYLAELSHAEATAKGGKPDAALSSLRALAKAHDDDPAVHHLIGLCDDLTGRYDDAVAAYEKALKLDPNHHPAAFRLGFVHALRGELDRAFEHYGAIADSGPTYFNALVNLGVLYEDRRQFGKAIECFRRVLRVDPNHQRARMFLKDAHASLDMVFDEDRQRELDRKAQLLSIPVTDFELSVRVRNCLYRMDIHTLGDLVSHTEEELLMSKNFGETSLQEIKEMLAARGLRLGQEREELEAPLEAEVPAETGAVTAPLDESVLQTPISDLDLSLRSRKCMDRLGIATIGQLIEHTPDELLASRNFGRTSLAEVAEKLGKYGLTLREPEPEEEEEEEAEDESPDESDATTDDAQ